jgi:hypothetical protein
MRFLNTVLQHSQYNGATVEKLGKAFGIFLLRPQGFRPDGGKKASLVIEALISFHADVL